MIRRWLVACAFILTTLIFPACAGADAPPFTPTMPAAVRGEDPQNPHPATSDIPPLTADYTLAATVGDPGPDGAIHVAGSERIRLTNTGAQGVTSPTFNVPAVAYCWFRA